MTPYYQRDGVALYQGDCLDIMPSLAGESFGAVVTDPPYFVPANHYSTRRAFPRTTADLSLLERFYFDWFAEAARLLRPTGVYYVFCDGQSYPVFFPLALRHVKSARPLIWDKGVSVNGYAWRHQHELILYAELPGSPAVRTGDGDVLRYRAVPIQEREHPAQKPVDLLERLLAKHADADPVLDPFAGRGTTLEAALLLGRRAVGIEIEERYCELTARALDRVPAREVSA
jgi:site-specific DNA-methyltransferase (adenine-specific)